MAPRMIRFEHRAVPIVLAAVTIDVIGFGIVMPVLPALITEIGHMDVTSATRVSGWMLAVFAIAQFFAGPVLGNLGDRYGRRPVLIAAMLAFIILVKLGIDLLLLWLTARRASDIARPQGGRGSTRTIGSRLPSMTCTGAGRPKR